MLITIKKTPLTYQYGNNHPTHKKLKAKRYDNYGEHKIGTVSIAVLEQDGNKLAQYRVMGDSIVTPGILCWFYVEYIYPWRLQTGAQDIDRILTDGETFFLVSRDLAQSPFILNDFTRNLINTAITKFTENL